MSGGAVTLLSEPVGSSVAVGQAVSFSVQAGGAGPFTYQWFKDGVALAAKSIDSGAAKSRLDRLVKVSNA